MGRLQPLWRHGGRIADAMNCYPEAHRPWLDLSTGISPLSWKGPRAGLPALNRLPDPGEVTALEAQAANAFGATPDRVAATPGTEAAIRLLPRLINARSFEVLGPTYGGHAEAAKAAAGSVREVSEDRLRVSKADVLTVVNPNNPDGRSHNPEDLVALAEQRSARKRWLVVDEAFVECTPDLSVAAAQVERLIVLRSFGKFYGLPGVRLGFVITNPALAAKVRQSFGDWPLCADAVTMGMNAYANSEWRDRTALRLQHQANRLDRLLIRAGFSIVGGTSLYRLVSRPDAADCFEHLCRAGILVRPFDYEPTWLRFGLPGPGGLIRLEEAFRTFAWRRR